MRKKKGQRDMLPCEEQSLQRKTIENYAIGDVFIFLVFSSFHFTPFRLNLNVLSHIFPRTVSRSFNSTFNSYPLTVVGASTSSVTHK